MYTVVLATMLTAGSAAQDWHCYRGSYCSAYCSTTYSCYSGYAGYSGYSGYAGYGCCYSACSCYSGCSSCSHVHWRPFHSFRSFDPIYAPSYCCSYSYCSSYCCSSYCCSSYCCSSYIVPQGVQVVPVPPDTKKKGEPVPPPKSPVQEEVSTPTAPRVTTSRVTVTLPSDAKLWVDNVECPLTSAERAFTTPPLDANSLYTYNLKIEVVREGRPVTATQRVVIVPGQPVTVNFNNAEAIVAR